MPRSGLDSAKIVDVAAALIDREGAKALSLARVAAELDVKPPSLYNHVDGLEGLERAIALRGIGQLAEACRAAAMGVSGAEALGAVAHAYRRFATEHPGVYPMTQVARPGDVDFEAEADRVLESVYAVLASFGIEGDDLIHTTRALRSALHGFASLETASGFGIDLDPSLSFERMIDLFVAGFGQAPNTGTT